MTNHEADVQFCMSVLKKAQNDIQAVIDDIEASDENLSFDDVNVAYAQNAVSRVEAVMRCVKEGFQQC